MAGESRQAVPELHPANKGPEFRHEKHYLITWGALLFMGLRESSDLPNCIRSIRGALLLVMYIKPDYLSMGPVIHEAIVL